MSRAPERGLPRAQRRSARRVVERLRAGELALEGYASQVEHDRSCGLEKSGLAAVSAVELLLDDLIPQRPANERGDLLDRALALTELGLVRAEANEQHDAAQDLRSLQARVLRRLGRHDEARKELELNLREL